MNSQLSNQPKSDKDANQVSSAKVESEISSKSPHPFHKILK